MQETSNFQGVLSKNEILHYLKEKKPEKGIIISPTPDQQTQIGRCSIDIRLGYEFIITKETQLPILDVADFENLKKNIMQYQERIRIGYGDPFILHPREFVLGASFEYISLPLDLMAYVVGRSSWGRLGLVIATATLIDPGFKGVITLELANIGKVPLKLYPCLRIAQLVFHKLSSPTEGYTGEYSISTGPKFSEIYNDKEIPWIVPKKQASTEDNPAKA
ncbi:MAG: dCTP deaminase [Candidatus Zixiibacteriota bacterium]